MRKNVLYEDQISYNYMNILELIKILNLQLLTELHLNHQKE